VRFARQKNSRGEIKQSASRLANVWFRVRLGSNSHACESCMRRAKRKSPCSIPSSRAAHFGSKG